jgi:hypothetical protein
MGKLMLSRRESDYGVGLFCREFLLRLQGLKPTLRLDGGRIKGQRSAIIPGCRSVIAKLLLRQTAVEISQSEARIEFDGPGIVANRPLVLLPIEVGVAAVVGDQGMLGSSDNAAL